MCCYRTYFISFGMGNFQSACLARRPSVSVLKFHTVEFARYRQQRTCNQPDNYTISSKANEIHESWCSILMYWSWKSKVQVVINQPKVMAGFHRLCHRYCSWARNSLYIIKIKMFLLLMVIMMMTTTCTDILISLPPGTSAEVQARDKTEDVQASSSHAPGSACTHHRAVEPEQKAVAGGR